MQGKNHSHDDYIWKLHSENDYIQKLDDLNDLVQKKDYLCVWPGSKRLATIDVMCSASQPGVFAFTASPCIGCCQAHHDLSTAELITTSCIPLVPSIQYFEFYITFLKHLSLPFIVLINYLFINHSYNSSCAILLHLTIGLILLGNIVGHLI